MGLNGGRGGGGGVESTQRPRPHAIDYTKHLKSLSILMLRINYIITRVQILRIQTEEKYN